MLENAFCVIIFPGSLFVVPLSTLFQPTQDKMSSKEVPMSLAVLKGTDQSAYQTYHYRIMRRGVCRAQALNFFFILHIQINILHGLYKIAQSK